MTTDETTIIRALNGCRFLPGSYTKRFVRTLAAMSPSSELTPRQAEHLWRVAWSYRRQLPRRLVELADYHSGRQGITKRERPRGQTAPPSGLNISTPPEPDTAPAIPPSAQMRLYDE